MSKTVIVTGASRGIGRAISLYYAKKGFNVCTCCHKNADMLDALKDEIENIGADCMTYVGNIGIFENGVYPGIHTLLSDLKKQGRSIALATSKPEVYARRILDKYELMPYFDVVVGSEMDGRRTDKGEVITEALRQLQVADGQRQEVLMIGDRLHDMIGAGKNHVDKLGVYYGYAHEGELEEAGADYTVCTVEELYDFFKAH